MIRSFDLRYVWSQGEYRTIQFLYSDPELHILYYFIQIKVNTLISAEPPSRKILGAWCYKCHRLSGGHQKNTRKSYIDLLNILKFDESDPILGSNRGELIAAFSLLLLLSIIADHGLHELIRDWLLDSTAPVFVNEC